MWTSQPSRIHVGAGALVGDADLEVGVAQQPPDDGRADRAGAAGDEHAAHRARLSAGDLGRRSANTWRGAEAFHGSTTRQSGRGARRRSRASASGPQNAVWLVATTTTSASCTRLVEARRRRGDERVVDGDVGQLALEQPDQLVRQRVALVVGVAP